PPPVTRPYRYVLGPGDPAVVRSRDDHADVAELTGDAVVRCDVRPVEVSIRVERERGVREEAIAPVRRMYVRPALPAVLGDVRLGEYAEQGERALLVEVVQIRVRGRHDVGGVRRVHRDGRLVVRAYAVAIEQRIAGE